MYTRRRELLPVLRGGDRHRRRRTGEQFERDGRRASFGDGVNLQPSYFCDGDQDLGWDLMNDYPDIETVRIEIEPFSFGEVATTVEDAKRWIDEAGANGKGGSSRPTTTIPTTGRPRRRRSRTPPSSGSNTTRRSRPTPTSPST